jgi:hypothetical protein
MTRFPLYLIAKLLAAMLLIIVIRALGEVFRLEYIRVEALTYAEIRPYIAGGLAAAVALALVLLAIWAGRPGTALVLACIAIAGLFVYRIYFFPVTGVQGPPPTAPATQGPA